MSVEHWRRLSTQWWSRDSCHWSRFFLWVRHKVDASVSFLSLTCLLGVRFMYWIFVALLSSGKNHGSISPLWKLWLWNCWKPKHWPLKHWAKFCLKTEKKNQSISWVPCYKCKQLIFSHKCVTFYSIHPYKCKCFGAGRLSSVGLRTQ